MHQILSLHNLDENFICQSKKRSALVYSSWNQWVADYTDTKTLNMSEKYSQVQYHYISTDDEAEVFKIKLLQRVINKVIVLPLSTRPVE